MAFQELQVGLHAQALTAAIASRTKAGVKGEAANNLGVSSFIKGQLVEQKITNFLAATGSNTHTVDSFADAVDASCKDFNSGCRSRCCKSCACLGLSNGLAPCADDDQDDVLDQKVSALVKTGALEFVKDTYPVQHLILTNYALIKKHLF